MKEGVEDKDYLKEISELTRSEHELCIECIKKVAEHAKGLMGMNSKDQSITQGRVMKAEWMLNIHRDLSGLAS
ncbi:MAG: hypothetical protein ABJN36_20135 [Cyclobacteriaceae bacterium]